MGGEIGRYDGPAIPRSPVVDGGKRTLGAGASGGAALLMAGDPSPGFAGKRTPGRRTVHRDRAPAKNKRGRDARRLLASWTERIFGASGK
jgi:hypothetical protein